MRFHRRGSLVGEAMKADIGRQGMGRKYRVEIMDCMEKRRRVPWYMYGRVLLHACPEQQAKAGKRCAAEGGR
jgi:hypothetical protein